MNWFFTRRFQAVWFAFALLLTVSELAQAQTITVGAVSPANPCPGSPVSVTITTTGVFTTGNIFTLQLSDGTGSFASPTSLTTLASAPTSASTLVLTGTLPGASALPYSSSTPGYQFRVQSSSPVKTSTNTVARVIGTPLPTPGSSGAYTFCPNSGLQPISAIGATLKWYNGSSSGATLLFSGSPLNVATSSTPNTYYVSQTVDGCESGRAAVNVFTASPTTAPNVSFPTAAYCPGLGAALTASTTGTGATLRWTSPSLSGGFQDGTTIATPQTTGVYNYTVSQSDNNNCVGALTRTFSLTVNARPASGPTINATAVYCDNAVPGSPITANLASDAVSLKWYNLTDNTQIVSATIPHPTKTTRYQVTQSSAACESTPTSFSITVNAKPGDPTPNSFGPFCQFTGTNNIQTITASGLNNGQNIEWLSSAAANATVVGQGNSFTVLTTGGNVPVYFRQNNGCFSNVVTGTVTINPTPAKPPVPTIPATYCSDEARTLTAALLPNATKIRWYPSAGAVSEGTNIPGPTQTTTYQISQFINSCEGPKSDAFTVTVNPKPGDPSPGNVGPFCLNSGSGNIQTITATGTANSTIEWFTDSNTPNVSGTDSYTVSTATLSPPTIYYQQKVNGCSSRRLALNVSITARPGAPTSAQSRVYCAGDAVTALSATEPGTLWYAAATGGTGSNQAPTPGSAAANVGTPQLFYVSQTVGNCESLSRQTVTVTVKRKPNVPTNIVANSFCQTYAAPILSAQTETGGSLRWFDGNTETTTPPNVPNNIARTYTYQVLQTVDGCRSDKIDVPVTVKSTPGVPVIKAYSLCQGQASSPLQATGSDLKYYDANDVLLGSTAPSPGTAQVTTVSYKVSQSTDGCEGPKITYNVPVNATPGAPTSAQSRTYCPGDAVTALAATEPGALWYAAATGGTGSSVAPTPSSAAANVGLGQVYYVSQTVGSCESQLRQAVTVTVKRKPGIPTNIKADAFCQNSTASMLSAQTEAGGSLRWFDGNTETATPPTVPNGTARTYTYQVSQIVDGCRSDKTDVPVTVKSTPGQPTVTAYSLCQNRASSPLQALGNNLKYYNANDVLLGGTAPSPGTAQVATVTYIVTQSLDGCEGPKITYSVPVYAVPGNPTFTQPRDYCAEDQATALSASGTSVLWYTTATGGSGSNQAPTPGTAASNVGSGQTFYVTQTVNRCESERQPIAVTVKRKPDLPTNLSSPSFCQTYSAPTLSATPEAGASLIWITDRTESSTAPTPPNQDVRTYTYQVLQTLNGCRSNIATVTATVKPTPGKPGITPFQLCQLSAGRALQVSGTELRYYDVNEFPLGTTAPIVPTADPKTIIYKVSQSTNGCEGPKIDYPVVVIPKPAPPITQAVNYCLEGPNYPDQPKQNTPPLTAQGQNLRWYFIDGNPYQDGVAPTIMPTQPFAGDFRVTQTVNNCISDQALLRVTIQATPTPTVASSLVTYCRNEQARPLEATGPNLRWIDPNGNLTTTTPTPPTVNATKGGDAYQVYAVGANGCASARNTIRLIINTNPTLGLLGSTTVNYGQTTTLKLRFTSSPPYTYTLTDGTSGAATDTLSTVTVKPLQTTTYRVASVSNVCGNGLPGNPATATIFVNIPTITTAALTGGTVCAGTSFVVGYATAGTFNAGNTFKVQVADSTAKNYVDVSPASLGNPLTATLPAALKGGVYFVRVTGTNPGAEVGGQRSPTLLTIRGLPGAVLTGTQNIYETGSANLSITLTGDGPWTVGYTVDGSQTGTFQTNANPHTLAVQPPKTATYVLTSVSNNCGTGPASGTATVTVLPLLAVENPLTGTLSLYPVPTQSQLTVAIDMPLSPAKPAQLTLRDLTGHAVLTRQTDTQKTLLDLSPHPAGIYLLQVQVGDHRAVRKVMKL